MKKLLKLLLVTAMLVLRVVEVTAQRKVWNNDRRPVYKGDTSIVIIQDQAYQKIVGVNYKLISEEILLNEFVQARDEIREQRRRLNQQMRRDSIALAKLEAELDMRRSFYRQARRKLKFASRKIDDIDKIQADKEQQEKERNEKRAAVLERSIVVNPKKKKEK